MKKGSPSGYDAETGEESAGSESSPGEPYECPSLYRIRRTQENHQFLRQDCLWRNCGRRQCAGAAQGPAAMGFGAAATLAGSAGSDSVQRLDLRHAAALRRAVGDGASRQNESHQRSQEEERHDRRPHHRRPGTLQPVAGVLCGRAAHPRTTPSAALSQPGGERSGAHEKQDGRAADGNRRPLRERKLHRKKYFANLLEELEEVPESVIDLLRLSRGALEMFESTQKRLVRELLADPELAQRVERLMSI